ncbi:MAG: helix-turn-helix domain-containing protein [Methyloceanibacter sp.]
MNNNKIEFTRGSGNIFADLDLPDAEELDLKSRTAFVICQTIDQLNLSQTAAARKLGISQPDVSRIIHGRLDGFSLERLLTFAGALGNDIDIKVKRVTGARPGRVRLRAYA